MKAGTSSLNPYAASYIPLSKRGAAGESKDYKLTAEDPKGANETRWVGPRPEDTSQSHHQYAQDYKAHGADTIQVAQDSALKGYPVDVSYGSSSQDLNGMTEKQILDEEFDMDLAYFQMTFPGISDESLCDVYLANKGDFEATLDMLNQLELYCVDSSEKLPDTLDIGDVLESGSSSELASQKLKEVAAETGGASSGSRIYPSSPI